MQREKSNSLFSASILAFLFLYHYVRLRHRVFKKFISLGLDSLGLYGDNQFEIEELYSRLSLMEREREGERERERERERGRGVARPPSMTVRSHWRPARVT